VTARGPAAPVPTYVFLDACTACGACLLTCPEHAIVATLPLQVRADRCTGCGECVEVCPADAVLEVQPPSVIMPPSRPTRRAGSPQGHDQRRGATA